MNFDNLPTIELSSRQKDYSNQKRGQLTYIKPSRQINGRTYWWMLCDCGNIVEFRSDAQTQACPNCTKKITSQKLKGHNMIDLSQKKFGKLTVQYPLEERKNNSIIWHCICDCGKEIDVIGRSLTSGNTKSCGCLKRQNAHFAKTKNNLVGQVFGYLTVLRETEQRQYGKVVWECQCDCGNIVYLNTTRLRSGNDTSCGCKKQSLGALNLIQILNNNNISYIKEYVVSELNNFRFDIAILNEKQEVIRLVEYDGEQHYRSTGGWNSDESFIERKKHDKIKNEYALSHNIPLVRIPYWERDNITLEMIIGDQYLVREPS